MALPSDEQKHDTHIQPADEMTWPISGAKPIPPASLTYEEFLDWLDEDTLAEWVDGTVAMTSPASAKHQEIVTFLSEVMGAYARYRGLGRVIAAPFQMKLRQSGREPDLLFVAAAHLDQVRPTYLDGPRRPRRGGHLARERRAGSRRQIRRIR